MLKISVSGVRGEYPESLTADVVKRFSFAFAKLIRGGTVLVGRDTRPSGRALKRQVFEGLFLGGCRVEDIGIVPTPTALFAVRSRKAAGAIVITASHNPNPWNGLKFISRKGIFLTSREANQLYKLFSSVVRRPSSVVRRKDVRKWGGAVDAHIRAIVKHVNLKGIRARRFRVAADMGNGAGAVATPKLLRALGCDMRAIRGHADGNFRPDPEPTVKNLKELVKLVKRAKADVGFAQDPDADRLAIVSERGRAIGEENTLALALDHVLSGKKGPVVVNVSTSSACDTIAKRHHVQLYRSRIGEANVVELMRRKGALIGGEGNGGVIYPRINSGRDSLVAMALVLDAMASRTGNGIEALLKRIPERKMVKEKIPLLRSGFEDVLQRLKAQFRLHALDLTDGLKIYFKEAWVHIRPSNTEPVVRLISEARTLRKARQLIARFKSILL
ncbi:MAG: phosphoglucosamine mutase [Candidatus Omnitrophica bacterium]|nr:phosphoglucosamine mutase [Candidatus Omnitrophota bacterium]